MTSRIAGCLLIGLSPLLGCRAHQLKDAYIIEAFSAEVRVLEDKLYEYDHRLDRIEQRLENAPPTPRADLTPSAPRAAAPRRTTPRAAPSDLPDDIPDLTPPEIDPGSPATPDQLNEEEEGNAAREGHPTNQFASASEPADLNLARIEISPFTRPAELDELPGIDGIDLIVLPLNVDGEIVPPEGMLTVVVVDAVERRHIGRWEFDPATVAARFDDRGTEAGIRVEIKFPAPLAHPDLHLFVRLETSEEERLEADRPFKAEKSSSRVTQAQRWTQRSAARSGPSSPAAAERRSATPSRMAEQPAGPPPEVYR